MITFFIVLSLFIFGIICTLRRVTLAHLFYGAVIATIFAIVGPVGFMAGIGTLLFAAVFAILLGYVLPVKSQYKNQIVIGWRAMSKTLYVAGFMFDPELKHVALIEKKRPDWQAGKLNGIGGHVEQGEVTFEAMVREFREETGLDTSIFQWVQLAILEGPDYRVDFFASVGPIRSLKSTTDEQVVIYSTDCITADNAIPNLTFLIPMAKLALTRGDSYLVQEVA